MFLPRNCLLGSVLCGLTHEYALVGTALGPASTIGMLEISPGDLRWCFHKATSADPPKLGIRTTVVALRDLPWGYGGSLDPGPV